MAANVFASKHIAGPSSGQHGTDPARPKAHLPAWVWNVASLTPLPLDGAAHHRVALEAMHAGCFRAADRLFERAARCYREEVSVEPLARLRTHQAIARLRASARPEPERLLEVERQLYRLRTIESLEPPFALIDAGRLLASWNPEAAAPRLVPTIARLVPRDSRRA